MFSVFNLNDVNAEKGDDGPDNLDIDDLYESKRKKDLQRQTMFKRILRRIHLKITNTSKIKKDTFCWVTIPEVILGLQGYNNADCIAYVTHSLRSNKFDVTYFHPNTLLISWGRWMPVYIREQIRLKTGIEVDELGEPIKKENQINERERERESEYEMMMQQQPQEEEKQKKSYTPISNYQSTGKIYGNDLMTNALSGRR